MAISASTEYTQMMIYTHHLIPSVSDPAKDSTAYVTCQYTFSPSSHSVLNFNQYDHDYSGSTLGNVTFNDTLPDSPTVSLGYVQGGGGVATYVRLTEAFAQALLDKLQDPYRVMLINGARLEISLNNATPESLDVGFNRMGSYLDYKFLTPTVDYQYMDEFDPYNPVVLPYGGYLNRTRQSYSMDITRMVQQVVSSSTPTSRAFVLAPSYGADLYGLGEAVLNMAPTPGNPTPLTVTVSYTLLR